ncbi:MAG: tetratricopeptide repeat protein [Pseudomonadota bacterium]
MFLHAPLRACMMALGLTAAVFATSALADDFQTTPYQNKKIDDFNVGKEAIDKEEWAKAIASFKKVIATSPRNADAFNYLGYASRGLGKLDDAFMYYDRALKLQPDHRGAIEYLGVAHLKNNDLPNAKAQLARLEAVCGTSCAEYADLAKEIAEFKPR